MELNKLYPYQLNNSRRLSELGFGCDLSEVGTGKTITAFAVIDLVAASRVLIITPKSVASQWQNKFGEFSPDFEVHRPQGSTKAKRREAYSAFQSSTSTKKALIVTYEQARMDIQVLLPLSLELIYADEVHRLGNPLTKTWKAVNMLTPQFKFGATATPLRSSPLQAFGIFNWLKPGALGKNFYHFKAKYTIVNGNGWVLGYKNMDELGQTIEPFYVKTTMEEAGHFMPELVEEDIVFPLSKKERALYENLRKEMLLEIEKAQIEKIENPTNLYLSVVKLGKMQEMCDSLELLGDSTESSKIDMLKDSLKDTLVNGNKAVVFTRFKRMADILARELAEYNPAVITGEVVERQAEIDKLTNDDSCKIIIGTTAMTEGINLERANFLYMVDVPLGSYGTLTQVIGRIKRIGQSRPMVVYYLMAENSVDIKLRNLLVKKQDLSERIFGSFAELREVIGE